MFKKLFSLVAVVLLCTAFSIPDKVVKKADKEITKFFEIEHFEKQTISVSKAINTATVSEFGAENLFKIVKEGTLLGYGYIGNAASKTATFDYLVLFDTDFIITKTKVLVYREEYGGEISSKRWLRQFEGASSASDELQYNQDIIPISGATISVQSMTRAVNNLLKSIAVLQKKSVI